VDIAPLSRPIEVGFVPFDFILLKDLALRVVADVANVDEATQVEDLRAELRHGCLHGYGIVM